MSLATRRPRCRSRSRSFKKEGIDMAQLPEILDVTKIDPKAQHKMGG